MGRKRKKSKVKKLGDEAVLGIYFEMNEDTDGLFEAYLDEFEASGAELWDKDRMGESALDEPVGRQAAALRSGPPSGSREIDLHGCRLEEAITRVDAIIRELLASGPRIVKLKVITGKGMHSGPGGSVLARDVHAYVAATFRRQIVRMDDSPADVTLGGLPVRGHFTVTLKRPGL